MLNISKQGLTQKASYQSREFYCKIMDPNIDLDHFLTLLRQFFLLKKETIYEEEKWMVTVRGLSGNGIPIAFEIPHHELVPGDIIQIKKGDTIPSNIGILASDHLVVNQALLYKCKSLSKKYPCEKILDCVLKTNWFIYQCYNYPNFA